MKKIILLLFFVYFNSNAQFWTEQSTGFSSPSRGVGNISIVDENIAWIRVYDGSDTTNTTVQEFAKTTDGGQTWVPGTISVGSALLGIAQIFGISDTTAWAVAYPSSNFGTGGIYKTIDGGVTWNRQNTALFNATGAFPNVVYFWDENNGFCMGDPTGGFFEIYTTSDGGNNWIRVPQSNIPDNQSGEYGYVGQVFYVDNVVWYTTNKGRIYKSGDFGHNWVVSQSPISDFGSATSSGEISFWNVNDGLLVNNAGATWLTSDGGATWTDLYPNSGIVFGGDISCIPNTNIVVSTSADSGNPGSSYSLNGGLDWTIIDSVQHLDVQFLNSNVGWSGGFNTDSSTGGIFKYTGNELLSHSDNSFFNLNFYPNPVVDFLNIKSDKLISGITIFNVFGQKVLTDNPNNTLATINVSSLSNGSYFLNINVNGKSKTIKFLK